MLNDIAGYVTATSSLLFRFFVYVFLRWVISTMHAPEGRAIWDIG
jgi:hypothetical protein